MEINEENTTTCLTIGDVKYVTTGNILFSDGEDYFIAESAVLQRFDSLIQEGILSNGMKWIMNKIKPATTAEE